MYTAIAARPCFRAFLCIPSSPNPKVNNMQNRVVTFRLSASEFAQISAHSARAGLSISASIRALVIDAIDDKKNDQIIKALVSIQSKINEKSASQEPPKDEGIAKIMQALVGLIDNVFLPAAAVDRKSQLKQIVQALSE